MKDLKIIKEIEVDKKSILYHVEKSKIKDPLALK